MAEDRPLPRHFGRNIAITPDWDGDDVPDLVLGLPSDLPTVSGAVIVISGRTGEIAYSLPAAAVDSPLPHSFGRAVTILNGRDGAAPASVAASAPLSEAGSKSGGVFIFSREHLSPLHVLYPRSDEAYFGAEITSLSDREGCRGDKIAIKANVQVSPRRYRVAVYDLASKERIYELAVHVPVTVSTDMGILHNVGDTDGDGCDDIAVRDGHAMRIVSGATGTLRGVLELPFPCRGGLSVAGGLDSDKDGFGDVILGCASKDATPGLLQVQSGQSFSTLIAPSPDARGGLGASICSVDDIDGDGVVDFVASRRSDFDDALFMISGADGSVLYRAEMNSGFPMIGWRLASGGDFDGDGILDFAATRYSPYDDSRSQQGVLIFSGKSGALLRDISPSVMQ